MSLSIFKIGSHSSEESALSRALPSPTLLARPLKMTFRVTFAPSRRVAWHVILCLCGGGFGAWLFSGGVSCGHNRDVLGDAHGGPLPAGFQRPGARATNEDGGAAVMPTSANRAAWQCSYHTNLECSGEPAGVETMPTLGTSWQRTTGFSYTGPPVLGGRKSNFSMCCTTMAYFVPGRYQFLPFIAADSMLLTVDGTVIDRDGDTTHDYRQARRRPHRNLHSPVWVESDDGGGGWHELGLQVSVRKESRSWALLSWVRLYDAGRPFMTAAERVACGISPACHGPTTECRNRVTNGLGSAEVPWGLCRDFVPKNRRCLVYSVGIRDIYQNELLMGREGCEVHAFDCTVDYPAVLGPNVTFHPWCLGTSMGELLLDGAQRQGHAERKQFLQLDEVVRRLGHVDDELTVLKMDCEGCEWAALDALRTRMPEFLARVRMMMLEIHLIVNEKASESDRRSAVDLMARVVDNFRGYRTYGYSINARTDPGRFTDRGLLTPELAPAGVHAGACCYEMSLVREDLVAK
jgi:hypothetical protein